jgi:hypothetical protein
VGKVELVRVLFLIINVVELQNTEDSFYHYFLPITIPFKNQKTGTYCRCNVMASLSPKPLSYVLHHVSRILKAFLVLLIAVSDS